MSKASKNPYLDKIKFRLEAWGFPKLSQEVFSETYSMYHERFESSHLVRDEEPFCSANEYDIKAAYNDLNSLRSSQSPDYVRWLWLELSLISSIEKKMLFLKPEEVTIRLENYLIPLTENQKSLLVDWFQEDLSEIEILFSGYKPPKLTKPTEEQLEMARKIQSQIRKEPSYIKREKSRKDAERLANEAFRKITNRKNSSD